jgi:Uma2 family endonuclease
LIEVSDSTLAKDLDIKKDLYPNVGIEEYWVINLQESVLIVFGNLTPTGYQSTSSFTGGIISPRAFPHVSIDVQALLR